jgi:hypothetical protein
MLGDIWFATWPSLERGDDLDMISFVVETFFERCDQLGTSALCCKRNRARFIIAFSLRITPTERKNGKEFDSSMDTRRDAPAFYSSVIAFASVDKL